MEIEDSRYAELVAAEQERNTLKPRVADLEEVASTVPTLRSEKEAAEAAKVAAEQERDRERQARQDLEELARASTLATERTGKLGTKFLAKLPEGIKTRLVDEQAKTLSDAEWDGRLEELASLIGVKADESEDGSGDGGTGSSGSGTFSRDEIASSGAGAGTGNGGNGSEPSAARRRSVIGGLAKTVASR